MPELPGKHSHAGDTDGRTESDGDIGDVDVAGDPRFGIKKLTISNWTEPDPTNEHFVRYSHFLQAMVPMDSGDWARLFLAVELEDHVPSEIVDLFDIARGAMLYGWFFYPMFQLGQEQLYRVGEAAAKRCYRILEGPKKRPTFQQAIKWLVTEGVISAEDHRRWEAGRKLRNSGSHPERASVMAPGAIARMVEVTATDINTLFQAVKDR